MIGSNRTITILSQKEMYTRNAVRYGFKGATQVILS